MRRILTHAIALGVGAVLALWLRPEPEVRERVKVEYVETFAAHEEWVTRRDATTDAHIEREVVPGPDYRRITRPDGTVEETGVVAVREALDVRQSETEEARGERVVERVIREAVEVERVVEVPDAKWALGPAVGWSTAGGTIGGAHLTTPPLGPLQFSAIVVGGPGEAAGFLTAQIRF